MSPMNGMDRAKVESTEMDHDTYREWLDLDLAGELAEDDRRRLGAHLESCAECRADRRAFEALDGFLAAGRVQVRPGFQEQVMASLPVAGWEGRSARAWRWPLAALAAMVVAIGALLGASSAELASGSMVGALSAVTDLLVTGALVGAGLLGASWQGIGLITREALGEIPGGFVAFTVLVACLGFLLFSLVRPRAAEVGVDAGRGGHRR